MRYEDVETAVRRQFLLDIGSEVDVDNNRRVIINKAGKALSEDRRIYREEGDFFRLIVYGSDAFILCNDLLYESVKDYFGARSPEFMLSFHNLRWLDERLKEHGFMIDEVQECFLPSFVLFEPDEDEWEGEESIVSLSGRELSELVEKGDFPHALVSQDKELTAWGFKPEGSRRIAAAVGAQHDGQYFWQVGIDVLSEYRGLGIASLLVHYIARTLIAEDKLPFYGVRPGNIISKKAAISAGFEPAFSEIYIRRIP